MNDNAKPAGSDNTKPSGSDNTTPAEDNKDSKAARLRKTIIFVSVMAAILLAVSLAAHLDHPIDMPANTDHIAPAGNPNPYCKQCHPPDSLPQTHPQKVKRAECTRCHKQTQKALPEGLRKEN